MKVPLIGPVKAGKSTYVAALYNTFNEGVSESGLSFSAQPEVRENLLRLHGDWVSCKEVQRTQDSGAFEFPLGTVSINGREGAEMVVPDRAGESFIDQWSRRLLEPEYVDAVTDALGLLVFLHPGHLRKPRHIDDTIDDLELLITGEAIEQQANSTESSGNGNFTSPTSRENLNDAAAAPVEEWNAEAAPTEVILVDLLQFADELHSDKPLPVALIVSAWDTIERYGMTPPQWVAEQTPLLAQYLESRSSAGSNVEIYGVSANGGDIDDEITRAVLLSYNVAADRAYLVRADGTRSKDMSLPLLPFLRGLEK